MMGHEVSLERVLTITGWSAVVLLIGSAWVVGMLVSWHAGVLLATTGCALSASAATMNIRCYMLRLANLIRATSATFDDDRPVRRVR